MKTTKADLEKELVNLQQRCMDVEDEIANLLKVVILYESADAATQLKVKRKSLSKMLKKINNIESILSRGDYTDDDIVVSDHALIRYMERGMSFDFSTIRSSILESSTLQEAIAEMMTRNPNALLGQSILPLNEKLSVLINNKTIITVFKREDTNGTNES